jgi:hypothetical protein
VSKFGDTDTMKITRNNPAFFPSFKTGRPTRCGDKLLQTLLVRAAPVLGRTSTSAQTRPRRA